jgi:hypothetical protein
MGNPGDFSSETLNVILLTLQNILRHEQRERAVLDANALDLLVEPVLDLFPNEVRSGLG